MMGHSDIADGGSKRAGTAVQCRDTLLGVAAYGLVCVRVQATLPHDLEICVFFSKLGICFEDMVNHFHARKTALSFRG